MDGLQISGMPKPNELISVWAVMYIFKGYSISFPFQIKRRIHKLQFFIQVQEHLYGASGSYYTLVGSPVDNVFKFYLGCLTGNIARLDNRFFTKDSDCLN